MSVSPQESGSGRVLAIATLVVILATILVNSLSNIFPPGGLNVGEIANTILAGVQITLANYAFAIWGLIYLGLIGYGIYQLRLPQRNHPAIRQANQLLILASLAQIAWIYLFTLQFFWWSVPAMLVILLALIGAYLQIHDNRVRGSRQWRWLAQVPFSLYLAWISVATIVNFASALYASGWNGWGLSGTTWTVLMLMVGGAIAAIVALQRADVAFTLVYVWAYLAIAVRQAGNAPVWMTAVVGAIVLVALLAIGRTRRKTPQVRETVDLRS